MSIVGGLNGEKGVPTIQSRHHIGFKDRQNQSFKANGPIRATGAIYERMDRDNNSFNSTYNRE